MSGHHGRAQVQHITLAAEKDGTVTGLKVAPRLRPRLATSRCSAAALRCWAPSCSTRIYKFPAYQFNCQTVFTNRTWTDAYRGAGRPEATFAIERVMDDLAAHLGVDPLEIREKNWIKNDEFPFATVAGLRTTPATTRPPRRRPRRCSGTTRCGPSRRSAASAATGSSSASASRRTPRCAAWRPAGSSGQLSYGAGGWEHAEIRMLATGKVEVVIGVSPHGQGHETAFSQIVADRLGVPFEDVEVLHGDTQVAARGLDTYGSRSLVLGGEAVVRAADKVIEKAKLAAAHLMEANVDDVEFDNGRFTVAGTDQGMGIAEVALATFTSHHFPAGFENNLDSEATFDAVTFSFPHGTHLCAMEVDTETGRVKIRKYVCVDDIGTVINPLIANGQVHGGVTQGIAQALWEEAVYDDAGTLVSGSFVDYLLPTAVDVIDYEIVHTPNPSTTNSLGTKGVGETGTIASTPAVVNAVVDAVRHLGVTDIVMPMTPERVWTALQGDPGGAETVEAADAALRGAGGRADDPRTVRLPGADLGRGGPPGAGPASATTRRSSPAGRACCRCCGCGSTPPRWSSTSARSTRCAASATTATPSSSAR